MPETSTSSNNPPDVDIKVKNGSGGGGDHIVGLFVCWNPAYLAASDPDPNAKVVLKKNEGFCAWYNSKVAANTSEVFHLTLKRKNPGVTWVMACTMDPATGAYSDVYKWEVPEDHPFELSAKASRAGKKKGKKKSKKKTKKNTNR